MLPFKWIYDGTQHRILIRFLEIFLSEVEMLVHYCITRKRARAPLDFMCILEIFVKVSTTDRNQSRERLSVVRIRLGFCVCSWTFSLTCRLKASGIVNVELIQQKVLTTCVGMPLTMQEMGLPTYCVAVMIREHVNSSTVVKTLCSRKTALSVWISWILK